MKTRFNAKFTIISSNTSNSQKKYGEIKFEELQVEYAGITIEVIEKEGR